MKFAIWTIVTAEAKKLLGAKGKLPAETPSVLKAYQDWDKADAAMFKARDQFVNLVVEAGKAAEGLRIASAAYRKKIENDDYGLNEDDAKDKKIMAAVDAMMFKYIDVNIATMKEREQVCDKVAAVLNSLTRDRR